MHENLTSVYLSVQGREIENRFPTREEARNYLCEVKARIEDHIDGDTMVSEDGHGGLTLVVVQHIGAAVLGTPSALQIF